MMRRSLVVLAAIALLALSVVVVSAQQGGGGGRRGGRMMGRMGGLGLLRDEAVQKELKMTPAQVDKLDAKQQEVMQQAQELIQNSGGDFRSMTPEDRAKFMEKMQTISHKAVADILDSTQMHRFHQLELQREGPTALLHKEVADKLGLSETQRATLMDIEKKAGEERRAMMEGKNPRDMSDEDRQKMRAMTKATHEKMLAVLTPGQLKTWKDMQGEPFHFTRPGGGPGGQGA